MRRPQCSLKVFLSEHFFFFLGVNRGEYGVNMGRKRHFSKFGKCFLAHFSFFSVAIYFERYSHNCEIKKKKTFHWLRERACIC